MQYETIFYILSAVMIIASVLSITLNKFIPSAFSVAVFMTTCAILSFFTNSFVCGGFQILTMILTVILFTILYKTAPQNNNYNIFKTKKFWAGLVIFFIFVVLAGLFINYINLTVNENPLIIGNKTDFSPYLSALITTKSVFFDYFLPYFYIVFIFIVSICAVWLLVKEKSKGEKND